MTREVLERARADILSAERTLRRIAEDSNLDLRRVLTEVAYRTAGEALEDCRRLDPNAPQAWSPAQWREFFTLHLRKASPGWGGTKDVRTAAAQGAPGRDEADRRLAEALAEIERLKRPPVGGDGRGDVAPATTVEGTHSGAGPEMWPVIPRRPPARFADRLGTGIAWKREALALYLMATRGWSSRLEVLEVVGRMSEVGRRSGSLRRTFDTLLYRGLISGEVLTMTLSRPSRMFVARLTDLGRELCLLLGWQPVESEWDRLNRLHEGLSQPAHSAAVLAFAYHARRRGWTAEVLPAEIDLSVRPDVCLEKDGKRLFVEVEFEGDKPAKWCNLSKLQGFVALCAPTPAKRSRMVAECKLGKLSGMATDLETLIQAVGLTSPLWVEEW